MLQNVIFLRTVTVIFKNFSFEEKLNKLMEFIKSNRIFKYTVCGVLCVASVITTLSASGLTLGYKVSLSDKVIAVVSSPSAYDKADQIVLGYLDKDSAEKAGTSPKFGLTLTTSQNIDNTADVVKAIIDNNEEIVEAYALILNDSVEFYCASENINDILDARRTEFFTEGAKNSADFVEEVALEKGYCLKSDLWNMAKATEYVNKLEVKTVSLVTKEYEIPYETKNVKTSEKPSGYSKVTQEGENGISQKTVQVVSINGEVSSKAVLSKNVIKEQISEIVTVGTAVSTTARAQSTSVGFICPVSRGSFTVSAYYGDGRNHKGIDLAADCGTPIFAVADGTVTYAGYDSDYGYNVIIKHSNGLQTRYAHANALCVSTGATVSQGEMIATVGSTGWSTGNHLHFEVIVGGTRVNPAPYIGL